MSTFEKQYTFGDHTIVWKADLCQHSGTCFRNLPDVFNPLVNPWIKPENADPETVVAAVRKCPSGALSMLSKVSADTPIVSAEPLPQSTQEGTSPTSENGESLAISVHVAPNGPYRIMHPVTVVLPDGTTVDRPKQTVLCRCGHSKAKPFCDGSHAREGFVG